MLIGTFSKYVKTTVKTLRYYDRIGLFRPTKTDPVTGYRYYTMEQLSDFEQIRQYRAIGLSVEQISRLLANEKQETVLLERQQELIEQENLIKHQKEAIAKLLNSSYTNSYDVKLKKLPTYTVCTSRMRVYDSSHIIPAISKSFANMKQTYPSLELVLPNYCCITFTDKSHYDTNMEIEYAEAVSTPMQNKNNFIFRNLPGATVAYIEYYGSYDGISAAYATLLLWITSNGYQITGAVRERFIHGAWDRENEAEWLTEIQIPLGDIL